MGKNSPYHSTKNPVSGFKLQNSDSKQQKRENDLKNTKRPFSYCESETFALAFSDADAPINLKNKPKVEMDFVTISQKKKVIAKVEAIRNKKDLEWSHFEQVLNCAGVKENEANLNINQDWDRCDGWTLGQISNAQN